MKLIRNIDDDFWWDVAQDCDYATFFHTPLWHRAATETYRDYKDATVGFELGNGTQAVIPLLQTGSRKVFRNLISTFAGCYGDFIANGPVPSDEREEIYRTILAWDISLHITGNPFSETQSGPSFYTPTDDFTQVIALRDGYESIWNNYKYSCQKQIKKGRDHGFAVRPALSSDDINMYYDIYTNNLKHWGGGKKEYPKKLFEFLLAQDLPGNGEVLLWIVETDQREIVGGNLNFYWNHHVVEWHAVYNRDFFKYGVRNFLVDYIIKHACDQGENIYDFNPSGGYEGVVKFKSTFGAEIRPLKCWAYQGNIPRIIRFLMK